MQTTIYNVGIYARLSRDDERAGESVSIENQKEMLTRYVHEQGWNLISTYVDDGVSGTTFDRQGLNEMISDARKGKINLILVKDLSRFGRDYIETGKYIDVIFPSLGCCFIALNDGVDTIHKNNEMITIFKNVMNDFYCRDISIKTRSALEAKRNNGDYVGACTIYGYKKDDENKNHLVADEYAAKVVQDIFKMKIEGMSASRIADELNRLGILSPIEYKKNKGLPHPTGGYADRDNAKWSATTIIRILKDETYTGVLLQGKQSTHNYKLKKLIDKPVSEWVRKENTHEAIIRKQDFDLVQKIMKLDTRISPNKNKVYLFSGILICGGCGNRMTRISVPYKENKYYYYHCPTGKKNGCTLSNMIKESDLINCVSQNLKSHIRNVISFEELLNSINSERINKELMNKIILRIKENEERFETVRKYKSSLYENFINDIVTKEEYTTYKKMYSEEQKCLENAAAELQKELENVMNNNSENFKWIEHFKRFADLKEINRTAVIQLIQSIKIFGKNKIQINFNYQPEYEKAMSFLAEQKEVF